MRISFSTTALFVVFLYFTGFRSLYLNENERNGYNATSWDAFGYYMYLPGTFIYNDIRELHWIPTVDSTYSVIGGDLYQAIPLQNGGYTGRYFVGVSILQSPFFGIGHLLAHLSDAKTDGFSRPYQYALIYGAILWVMTGLWFLCKVLREFFSDKVTALTLLLLAFTTNLVQYTAKDGAMSHAFIFPLYAFVLWLTWKWHRAPAMIWAALIGFTIGLATICRPTEFIMIFIPLLWNTQTPESRKQKWAAVFVHRSHVWICLLAGVLALVPQLSYWKFSTGSWIFDVGSKWVFFNPWWRVLFGPETGWFTYTPVAIGFIVGFFCIRKYPFRNAVITFCLLNIWIVIAWFDWKYGASYSTRALVQSLPVCSLPLAGLLHKIIERKWGLALAAVTIGLMALNTYHVYLYNHGGTSSGFSVFVKGF